MLARSRPLAIALAAAALAVAGCGDDDDERGNVNIEGGTDTTGGTSGTTGTTGTTPTTPEEPTGAPVATLRVRETDFEISPKNPRIARTGVVAFRVTNAGNVPHALEVEGPTGERETDNLAPGDSATLRVNLNRPGRYKWYCPVGDHEERGMTGMITVAGGGGGTRTTEDDDGSGTSGGGGRGGGGDRGGSGGGGVGGY